MCRERETAAAAPGSDHKFTGRAPLVLGDSQGHAGRGEYRRHLIHQFLENVPVAVEKRVKGFPGLVGFAHVGLERFGVVVGAHVVGRYGIVALAQFGAGPEVFRDALAKIQRHRAAKDAARDFAAHDPHNLPGIDRSEFVDPEILGRVNPAGDADIFAVVHGNAPGRMSFFCAACGIVQTIRSQSTWKLEKVAPVAPKPEREDSVLAST